MPSLAPSLASSLESSLALSLVTASLPLPPTLVVLAPSPAPATALTLAQAHVPALAQPIRGCESPCPKVVLVVADFVFVFCAVLARVLALVEGCEASPEISRDPARTSLSQAEGVISSS